MAPEGCAGLLPIPRSSREHDAVAHLQTSRVQAMAQCSGPPQPARTDALGTSYPSLKSVDSSTPRSAPLSRCTLLRHSSFVRAVCVDALVRICAGPATAIAKRRQGGLQARTAVNGKIAPKSIVIEVADLIPLWGRQKFRMRYASVLSCFRGSYR